MIPPGELVEAYNRHYPDLVKLKSKVDPLLNGIAREVGGRYVKARVKPLESLLLKIERDSPELPFDEIEDLVAATIVVRNPSLLEVAEQLVGEQFQVVEEVEPRTRKPTEFIYDDRQLLLALLEEDIEGINLPSHTFELQIKTELQAAAASISRDLDYKPRWLTWARSRLASSLRALVEMADTLLDQLAEQADNEQKPPPQKYKPFDARNEIIRVLENNLPDEQLPEDRRRLSIIVERMLDQCEPKVTANDLENFLLKGDYEKVSNASSITAAGSVFIILVLEGRLASVPGDPESLRGRQRFLITQEMIDICPVLASTPSDRRIRLAP